MDCLTRSSAVMDCLTLSSAVMGCLILRSAVMGCLILGQLSWTATELSCHGLPDTDTELSFMDCMMPSSASVERGFLADLGLTPR